MLPNLEFNSNEDELVVVLKSIAPPIKFIELAEDLEGETSFALTKLCLKANLWLSLIFQSILAINLSLFKVAKLFV